MYIFLPIWLKLSIEDNSWTLQMGFVLELYVNSLVTLISELSPQSCSTWFFSEVLLLYYQQYIRIFYLSVMKMKWNLWLLWMSQLNSKVLESSTNEAYEVGKQLESGILKILEWNPLEILWKKFSEFASLGRKSLRVGLKTVLFCSSVLKLILSLLQ